MDTRFEDISDLRSALEEVADPTKAGPMAAYMQGNFEFFGIPAAARRAAQKPTLTLAKSANGDELIAFARACWGEPEREFQLVAVDVLRKRVGRLEARHLDALAELITERSWWDTVDGLAAWVVGPLVQANPELSTAMDRWIDSPNIWLARTAILHQLGYKTDTDPERLFHYADTRAADTEFFIRKALGWALRQYARVDPDAVRAYVDANEAVLSGLTKREALKHLR